jgi:hypothetical protein
MYIDKNFKRREWRKREKETETEKERVRVRVREIGRHRGYR